MKTNLILIAAFAASQSITSAALLAQYNFAGGSDANTAGTSGVTVTTMATNESVIISSSTNTMAATSNQVATGNPGPGGDFGQFGITPTSGNLINFTNLTATVLADNGSNYEANWALYSSDDNFASSTLRGTGTDPAGGGTTAINIPLTGLTGITSQTQFQLVPYFTTSTGEGKTSGKVLRIDNVEVNGDVLPVPEPSSSLLIAVGMIGFLSRRSKK